MNWSEIPTWLGAVAATIAAVASVVTWLRGRPAVDWTVNPEGGSRHTAINIGKRTAHDVQVRVGSKSDPTDTRREEERHPGAIAKGETFVIYAITVGRIADDHAINLTWREGLLRRRKDRSYQLT